MQYKQEKLRTPWDVPNAPAPHPRANWSEIAQQQRQFNPVLQRPVKTAAAERLQLEEAEHAARLAHRAMETRLKQTIVHYDPITNETRYPSKIPPPKREHIIADTRTDYNVLNFQEHYNKDRWHQFTKAKPEERGKKTDFPAELTYAKDFDILSTKYKDDHDARVQEEERRLLAEKQAEFRKRNTFNPVRGVFYDTNKEIAFRLRRKEFMEQHSQQHEVAAPYRNADGSLYNILNNEVLDPEGLARKEALDNRSVEGCKKKNEFEQLVKQRQLEEYERDLARKLAGVSHKRDGDIRARGYDPITNEPFSGVGAKVLAPSQQVAKPSPWEQAVQASVRVRGDNQERRTRVQSSGQRALRSGGGGLGLQRSSTAHDGSGGGGGGGGGRPEGPRVPFIPAERKLSTARPRGQTGRVNN